MCAGASLGGLKAMTATSGPGYTLMHDAYGWSIANEIPLVVVDAMRVGPVSGITGAPGQGEFYVSRYCSQGGKIETIVLSPASLQEAFWLTIDAFNLAERFRTVVTVLTDQVIRHVGRSVHPVGGQGVIRMGQILGLCAINQGHRVTMLKSHGTETRGGYVRAQVVIAPDYVDSPVVENADIFVAFSAPAYRKFYDYCAGKILYDPEMVEEVRTDAPERHVAIAATALSKQHFDKPLFANMIMLGALTRVAGMDVDAMAQGHAGGDPRFHEENLRALDLGYTRDEAVQVA